MAKRRQTQHHEDTISIPPTEQELATLMDADYWDWETPVEVVRTEHPGLIFRIRLEGDDVRILGPAARAANMPLSRYILHAALETAKRAQ